MFAYCSNLSNITISEGVKEIGNNAFANCTQLQSITIPSTITSIGYEAFSDCILLKTVIMKPTTPPSIEGDSFDKITDFKIKVPASSLETYKTKWSSYAEYIEADTN